MPTGRQGLPGQIPTPHPSMAISRSRLTRSRRKARVRQSMVLFLRALKRPTCRAIRARRRILPSSTSRKPASTRGSFRSKTWIPVSDRRPQQFARLEPYDPVGFRIGSFVLFPEANFSQTVTDNVTSSNDPESDSFQSIKTDMRLVSNWQRHALELRGTTDSSFHDKLLDRERARPSARSAGRLDMTSRTNVQVIASTGVTQEKRRASMPTVGAERRYHDRPGISGALAPLQQADGQDQRLGHGLCGGSDQWREQ